MMPTKTYELRNLYFEQHQSSASPVENTKYKPIVSLPQEWNFKPLGLDIQLLASNLNPVPVMPYHTIAEQVFGTECKKHYVSLRHAANLLQERSDLHCRHLRKIDRRHIEAQEKMFGASINHTPENAKRVSNLEGQLAQLDKERRDEEVAFWKDTVDLRQQLFESGWNYRDAHQRIQVFSDVEAGYDH